MNRFESIGPARPARRRFLKQGAAVAIAFTLTPRYDAAAQGTPASTLPGSLQTNRRLDAWLAVNADGTVTVYTGKVELGQGITTALAQIVADELDVDLARISMVSGDTSRTPNEGVTSGSLSIEQGGTALRFAAAEARALLLAAAATKLSAPASELGVADGVVTAADGKRTTYWEVTSADLLRREATAKSDLRPAASHKVIGKSVPRRDIPAKVTGGVAYVQDMRLPGLLFGRVVRPPSYRAKLRVLDDAAVRAMPGVVAVVRDGSFLAVAAEREEQAIAAAQALRSAAQWDEHADLPPADAVLFAQMKRARTQDSVVSEKTRPDVAATATRRREADYTRPYMAHASIGPSCALAQWTDGKLTVWSHTQGVFPLRGDLAKALSMRPVDIVVIHREGSGCYGQNGADDVALDAALVARAAKGRPVKLQWMREDEFAWEPYGSAMAIHLAAGLDAAGSIVDWQHDVWTHTHSMRPGDPDGCNLLASWHLETPLKPGRARDIPQPSGGGDRNAVPLYVFPQQRIVNHLLPEMPIRVSALRTLGGYANVFAVESFIDELAADAGADPVAFRLRHLEDPRAKAVIEAVTAAAGWRPGAKGDGRHGRGIGFAKYKNLAVWCAVIAEVEVDPKTGAIRVPAIWAAADAGMIVNPDGLANQIEGGCIQSTSWTLREAVRYDDTRILTRSWSDYPILSIAEVPRVEVKLIDRPSERPLGVGEGSQGPTAAAIANAFANATGRRLRDLPFTPERVKALLA
jgi:CO/xanthine dehydrogenase Mo-binding subunit